MARQAAQIQKAIKNRPDTGNSIGRIDLMHTFNWYFNNKDAKDARMYLEQYFTANNNAEMLDKLNNLDDKYIPKTAGWLADILNNGKSISPDASPDPILFIYEKINESTKYTSNAFNVVISKPSIKEVRKKIVSNIVTQLMEIIADDDKEFNLYEHLVEKDFDKKTVKIAIEELKEMESNDFVEKFIADFEKYLDENFNNEQKTERKARKKKVITADKLCQHMMPLDRFDEFGLVSIEPERILGSNEVWCYVVNRGLLVKYVAKDANKGMSVYRTQIIDWCEEKSCAKVINKNAAAMLEIIKNGQKPLFAKIFDMVSTSFVKTLPKQIDKNVILMKAYK